MLWWKDPCSHPPLVKFPSSSQILQAPVSSPDPALVFVVRKQPPGLSWAGSSVACVWISRGSCPGSQVISTMASTFSPSLPSYSSTSAASPTQSPLVDFWGMPLTIIRCVWAGDGSANLQKICCHQVAVRSFSLLSQNQGLGFIHHGV